MFLPDLIFLQGKEVVLKMALVLLGNHKELIKQCIGFESIVEFLKTTLPEMGIIQLERVINEVNKFSCQMLSAYCNVLLLFVGPSAIGLCINCPPVIMAAATSLFKVKCALTRF